MEKQLTNNVIPAMTRTGELPRVNDFVFRLIMIPAFGISIPLLTRMIEGAKQVSGMQVVYSFAYTILMAFVIWEGNRYLHFSLRSYFDWHKKPVHKIVAMLLTICFYTIPVSILMMIGWYKLFNQGVFNQQLIAVPTLVILICVIFIAHVYETVILVKQSESDMLRNEQLERAKAEAELEALKNQIDPHFIFNSLNTLSHLIEEKPDKAKRFNDSLADMYRYILQSKARELVLLGEEMRFLEDYFSMLQIRFEKAIVWDNKIPCQSLQEFAIPPITLQLLIENAVKHNEFSDISPLILCLKQEGNTLVVSNEIRRKAQRKESSRIGLINLEERFKLITDKSIVIKEEDGIFSVHLPLLPID